MKKDLGIIFGLFLLIAVILVFGRQFSSIGYISGSPAPIDGKKKMVSLTVGGLAIDAEIARKPSERKKGLSKRDSLPLNQGMLFVFDKKGKWGIWMKDMKLAIDIVWIDENKKIVDIAASIAPEPKRDDDELTIYRPRSEALYVLEINAGLSALHNLQIGDNVNFDLQ